MAISLNLSDREVGLLMRCLMDAENHEQLMISQGDICGEFYAKRAARIRSLRQKIVTQRKRKPGLNLDFHAKGVKRG